MNKMTVKEFVEGYNKCVDSLKKRYIEEKLTIVPYVPVLKKEQIINNILNLTMYTQEKYTKKNGIEMSRKTDDIEISSFSQYILFCRVIIENYTNLTPSDPSFTNDYDLLKSSGLLDILIEEHGKIPFAEVSEFKSILEMKKADIMNNYYEPHSYISRQVERFGTLANITIEPLMKLIEQKIEGIPLEDINNVIELVRAGDFKEV